AAPLGAVIHGLWVPATGTNVLYAVGDAELGLARTSGGAWVPLTPPVGTAGCNLRGISGAGGEILAVGGCAGVGVVWSLAGTTWTEVRRGDSALHAIAFDPSGNVYVAGDTGGARRIAGTWTDDAGA